VTGLIIVVLLTFFLLKDGERMWAYVVRLMGRRARDDSEAIGRRVYAALAGYVRGIALVGLVDALLIGIALVIIGVPLVVPLMIITFFAAFVPLIGAFVAGLVAVLIALVSGGLVDAVLVLGAMGGIVGVFLAVPVAGIVSVILDFARDRPAPESPLLDEPAPG